MKKDDRSMDIGPGFHAQVFGLDIIDNGSYYKQTQKLQFVKSKQCDSLAGCFTGSHMQHR